MPQTWITDDSGVRHTVIDPYIGDDASVPQRVEKIWCGDDQRIPRLVFTRAQPSALTATPLAWNTIRLQWGDGGNGVTYRLFREKTAAGTPRTLLYDGTGLAYDDNVLSPSSTYTYTLDSILNGQVVFTTTATATTPVRPTRQKFFEGLCSSSGTYAGPGADVGTWARRATNYRLYAGFYDWTYASQHSGAYWSIPSDVRNCISVDRVQVSMRVQWAPYAPDTWHLAAMFATTWPSTWPSSTGVFGGFSVSGKDTWLSGSEWFDIGDYAPPNWPTVKECLRTRGMSGLALLASGVSSGGIAYGYVNHATAPSIRPRLRIWYTVYA